MFHFVSLLSSAVVFFSSKFKFSKKKKINHIIRVSNSLDQDQVQRYVGPALGTNCLQGLLQDDKSRHLQEKS